ncbi:MAG: hypothetical protein FWD52_04285 [Candidatus Bathyarchaeota archaeon]|nr:hypothetical protein [Candidatus Termiticorpusculum sp.]
MNPNVNTKHNTHNKKTQQLIITLLLITTLLLTTTIIIYKLTTNNTDLTFVDEPISLEDAVYVKSESELKTTINNALPNTSIVIALDNDVVLSEELVIPSEKNITLTSSSNSDFYKLIGAYNKNTTLVEDGGRLRIAGIIITHSEGDRGRGVFVEPLGTLILSYGKISDNTYPHWTGVVNVGTFIMFGGEVSNNNATGSDITSPGGSRGGSCGGVYNCGTFIMLGGKIKNNVANGNGGGVSNLGTFTMLGGEISNNLSTDNGGGIHNRILLSGDTWTNGTFIMKGGAIANNTAENGGGVYSLGTVIMTGGKINDNKAWSAGGGVYSRNHNSNVFKGTISNNNAKSDKNLIVVDEKGNTIITK